MTDPRDKPRYSVEGMLTIAVSVSMLLLVVSAGFLHVRSVIRRNRADDQTHLGAYASLLADQVGERLQRQPRTFISNWAAQAAGSTRLRLVAVMDRHDNLIAAHPSRELYEALIESAAPQPDGDPVSAEIEVGSERLDCLLANTLIHAPSQSDPVGRLVVAMDRTPLNIREALAVLMPLAAIAVVLNFLILSHLHRRLITPLRHLAGISKMRIAADLKHLENSLLADEFQCIGRLIRHLNDGLEDRLQDIADLESTVERRVDARTRQITNTLKRTQKQSWTDPLTKLYNRRVLKERLNPIIDAQLAASQDLAVVMFDVDHFKQTNDRLGHRAGDAVLEFIGDLFRGIIRDSDLAARYGGDEFVLVLPATSADEARHVTERILTLFRQHASTMDISPRPSLSAGIASLARTGARDGDRLLLLADEMLYTAKQRGKSIVAIFGDAATVA